MGARVAGIPDLQGVFDAQPTQPQLTVNAGVALEIVEPTASSAASTVALMVSRDDGGVGAVGDGIAIDLAIMNAAGARVTAARIATEWLTATGGSESAEVVFSTRIAGIFAEGLRVRPLGVDLQFVTPFAFVLSPNADLDDGLRISTVANDVYVIPQQATNAFYLGNSIADPTIDLNRIAARAFDIIPLGTTLTSNTPGNWIDMASTVVINVAPTGSLGGFVSVSGSIEFRLAGSAFGAGNLFKIQGTIKNESGASVSIGSQYTFVHIGTYQADGAFAMATFFHRICLFQPTWNVINAATMSVSTVNVGGLMNPTIGASVTVTNMRDWEWAAGTFTGTVTNRSHLYFPVTNTPAATIFAGIQSLLTASANHRFISHTGTAQSDFGGVIGLGAGATVDWTIERLAANIATLGAGDSLRIPTTLFMGASGSVSLSEGAANRLDLATGDSFNIVSGDFTHAGTNFGIHGSSAPQSAAYTPTNVSTDRAYDANSTSVNELADVVGTLIADLQAKGFIG